MQVSEFTLKQESKKFEPEVLTRSIIDSINYSSYISGK